MEDFWFILLIGDRDDTEERSVVIMHIQPAKPQQNAYVER